MSVTHDSLVKYLAENFGVDAADLDGDTPLFTSGLLDSFSVGDVLMFIEERGNFTVEPEEVVPENLDSIDRIVAYSSGKSNNSESLESS